jgi:Raf kinase inhibitor-like YbhB/YbcL family protein
LKLLSKEFTDGGSIPSEFTCDGKNISPQLSWENIPTETKSFALVSDDPDAFGGWIHWLVYDIPNNVRAIEKNSLPAGAKQVENDFGKKPYGGPCPPSGTHRYFFRLYALDVEHLEQINKHNFVKTVEKHAIEKATIMGLYERHR